MAKRVSVDKTLFVVTKLLVLAGLVMVFSASAMVAKQNFGSPYHFFLRQLLCAVAGLAAMFVAMKVDYHRYKHPAVVFSLLAAISVLSQFAKSGDQPLVKVSTYWSDTGLKPGAEISLGVVLDILPRRYAEHLAKLPPPEEARQTLAWAVLRSAGEISAADLAAVIGGPRKEAEGVLERLAEEGTARTRSEEGYVLWSPAP